MTFKEENAALAEAEQEILELKAQVEQLRLALAATARDNGEQREAESLALQAQVAELKEELEFFLEQSIIIEHKQDHDKMRNLRKKYGYEF